MIPILYDNTETDFTSNGLGRLRDVIEAVVTEERNGVYELSFQYPVDGVNYDRIQCGRIVAVEHDESGDLQPFDIVGYSRPIKGVVTFHAVHVSYRQCALTVSGTNINSLADAFTLLGNSSPANPFTYWTDKTSTGFLAAGDGVPHSVRSILGGMEGSILDSYGGEYEFDKWTVRLWSSRGQVKPLTIRYGVNLMEYQEDVDYSNTYTACIPYWTGQDDSGNDVTVKGSMQQTTYPSFNGTTRCIPLDVTDKFESKPTVAQVEAEGLAYINNNQTYLPEQNITVDFIRLSDSPEYEQFATLQTCKLCDSVNVVFPRYNMEGLFKIVKTEYDVLQERYQRMELGALSTSLAEALGINQESSNRALNFDQMLTDISDLKTKATTITPTCSVTASVGTLVSVACRRYGNVVFLRINAQKSTATNAGANCFEGTLNTAALRPQFAVSGAGYYGQYSLIIQMDSAGKITIRNANASSFAAVTGANNFGASLTYIVQG